MVIVGKKIDDEILSPNAKARVSELSTDFTKKLVRISKEIAASRSNENVLVEHVNEANNIVYRNRRVNLLRFLGTTAGGSLVGVFINALAIESDISILKLYTLIGILGLVIIILSYDKTL